MKSIYRPDLKAHLSFDDDNRVRHIQQSQEYFLSDQISARLAAADYLRRRAETLSIPMSQLERLHLSTNFLDPLEQDVEYREYQVKKYFASKTYCYYQTIHNTPVWGAGMTVKVKENPYRITHVANYGHDKLSVDLPPDNVIKIARETLTAINRLQSAAGTAAGASKAIAKRDAEPLQALINAGSRPRQEKAEAATLSWLEQARPTHGAFYVYRYDAKQRIPQGAIDFTADFKKQPPVPEHEDAELTLPLPDVPRTIRNGTHYLVAEIIFHLRVRPSLYWRALIDIRTGTILYLRALISGVSGLVFDYCPMTSTGDTSNTPDDGNAILNPLRVRRDLLNLAVPVDGDQALNGTHVTVVDDEPPNIDPPTEPIGTNFDYDARTNDFAAVSAYYHGNRIFDVIESLGFTLSDYFDGTDFPVHLDHRGRFGTADGIERNASCSANATGDGIGLVDYELSDLTDTTDPLGRAVDSWVHWHEICGHGILYDHVSSANFGFAHSAGDTIAALQNDPVSLLRGQPERFQYAPFRGLDRWFNRAVADGWGWGGAQDTGSYPSEQVLATTLFRVYQALGGDSDDEAKRWQASRVMTYLVLTAVGQLSPGTNPSTAEDFYDELKAADADDWTSEGYAGGAYHKVIRWAFEKQGMWRAAGAATTDIGEPDAVDLYIDDGRAGEYEYQAVHWNSPSVWNRTSADGNTTPQPGSAGVLSHAYVRVKNRGTTDASGTVKVYHCLPGAGLTWPTDFVQAGPAAGLPTGNVQANSGNEVIIGPFDWTPNENAYGHDCLLAIVEADGDPSNINNLEAGQTIQEWRLVPHDNNVGQRNVQLVPGGGGEQALMSALHGVHFFAGNNFNRPADMRVTVDIPKVLATKGWKLQFEGIPGANFQLKAGERRQITLRPVPGADFSAEEIRAGGDRDIKLYLHGNGILMGGMTYHVDPDMIEPFSPGLPDVPCKDAAQDLVDCLKVSGGRRVKKVCVKKVSVDIELENDCDSDC